MRSGLCARRPHGAGLARGRARGHPEDHGILAQDQPPRDRRRRGRWGLLQHRVDADVRQDGHLLEQPAWALSSRGSHWMAPAIVRRAWHVSGDTTTLTPRRSPIPSDLTVAAESVEKLLVSIASSSRLRTPASGSAGTRLCQCSARLDADGQGDMCMRAGSMPGRAHRKSLCQVVQAPVQGPQLDPRCHERGCQKSQVRGTRTPIRTGVPSRSGGAAPASSPTASAAGHLYGRSSASSGS
jgi:hypothetical protein